MPQGRKRESHLSHFPHDANSGDTYNLPLRNLNLGEEQSRRDYIAISMICSSREEFDILEMAQMSGIPESRPGFFVATIKRGFLLSMLTALAN